MSGAKNAAVRVTYIKLYQINQAAHIAATQRHKLNYKRAKVTKYGVGSVAVQ
jgi:hypothetical protein